MFSRKVDAAFASVPAPEADRPSWRRVSALAVIGFAVGVVWPKLAGVRLGPSAPQAEGSHAPGTTLPSATSAMTLPTNTPATASATAASIATPSATPPATISANAHDDKAATLSILHGIVLSCRNDAGDLSKGKECPPIAFDAVAVPRLKKLAQCPAAEGADGKLSVILGLEFGGGHVSAEIGKSSTVKDADLFGDCVKETFRGATLAGLPHDAARYTLQYPVYFGVNPSKTADPPSGDAANVADGKRAGDGDGSTIVWEVAKVRESPRTGTVIARLPRGTKVAVGTGEDGWYKIHFPGGGTDGGWVYRAAIGR